MFWNMFVVENQKLFKRAIVWVELAVVAVAVLAVNLMLFVITRVDTGDPMMGALQETLVWPGALTQTAGLASGASLGGILIIILTGAAMAQEYTWRTLQLWLSRGVPRSLFLTAKFAALLTPALLLVVVPLVLGGMITAVFSQIILGEIPFAAVEWGNVLWLTLATAYSLLPYAGLAFFLAVATRSTMITIGGGLAYTLLIEGMAVQIMALAGGNLAAIGKYVPAGLVQSMLGLGAEANLELEAQMGLTVQYLEPGAAAVGIALYTVAFVALSILVFRRQDLGG
jgi:ABC-type transport system involved in multi-copper enzyme maturation permease subunit